MLARKDERAPARLPRFNKAYATLKLSEYIDIDAIQGAFDAVPLDSYVRAGFRYKSIERVHVRHQQVRRAPHGPLFQPKTYNPVHGGIVRHYPRIELGLASLLRPIIPIFAACAGLSPRHEILVQAQRVTANSGTDGATGFPVVEGWHQDNTHVLGIFIVSRCNIRGGVSMLSRDDKGREVVFSQTLLPGDLLLVDDTLLFHNTTEITKVEPEVPAFRDIVILTWPSCREHDSAVATPPRRASA